MSRLPHVYLPPPWAENLIELDPQALHHLSKVLRLRDGAALSYTDGLGNGGEGILADGAVQRGPETTEAVASPQITMAVAPPKHTERARFAVEKLAELGVDNLVWLETERGEGRPPSPDKARSWAISALQQSRGSWLMGLGGPEPMAMLEPPMWAATLGGGALPEIGPAVTLVVGPEGGFSPDELEAVDARVSLGDSTLRTETAAVVFSTMVLQASGRIGPSR